ncbi:MAG: uroporphyrinogen decarboxylase family protein [Planctomycetota bacterium]
MTVSLPTNEEKQAVWDAYNKRRPMRVPVRWNVNPRIILLDPALNPEGYSFEAYCNDPQILMTVQSRFQEYVAMELGKTCDTVCELPEQWTFHVDLQNIASVACLGGTVEYRDGQVPAVEPFLAIDDIDSFVSQDPGCQFASAFMQDRLRFHKELTAAARDFSYLGRGGAVAPVSLCLGEGHLTTALSLFGPDFLTTLAGEPEEADRVFGFLNASGLALEKALVEYFGGPYEKQRHVGFADDSVQLISTDMYEEWVLPWHERMYAARTLPAEKGGARSIHLCGDATRHFPLIKERLGVSAFDTGFPVDFGWLRRSLGPEAEISGGPPVPVLQNGTPDEVAATTREILESGIMEGGLFILQEGNNLPPCCPMENLAALYETCLEYGVYSGAS